MTRSYIGTILITKSLAFALQIGIHVDGRSTERNMHESDITLRSLVAYKYARFMSGEVATFSEKLG